MHSTLATAALFLIAGTLRELRGHAEDRFVRQGAIALPGPLGIAFLIAAAAVAGLPPLSGFLGKVMVLQAATDSAHAIWFWGAVLISSFLVVLTVARAGIVLFWQARRPAGDGVARACGSVPVVGLLVCLIAMSVFAGPVKDFADAAAVQLSDRQGYLSAVLKR